VEDIRLDMRGLFALGRGRIHSPRVPLPTIVARRGVRGRTTLNLQWSEPAKKARRTARMPRTILAVEDDPLNLRLFHDMLTWRGYATLEANDVSHALALAGERTPDLVLLDVQLPGLSGLDLVRRFKADARLRNVPIIAVTALALRSHEEMIRAAGVDDYVTKPFSVAELMETVQRHLPAEASEPESATADEPATDGEPKPWAVAPGFSLSEPEH
jgi:two-component system, cell cycle response regulator DivK